MKALFVLLTFLVSQSVFAAIVPSKDLGSVDILKIAGTYKNRAGAKFAVTVEEAGVQKDLFLKPDYLVKFVALDDAVLERDYGYNFDALEYTQVTDKGSIEFGFSEDCDYNDCFEVQSDLLFHQKRNGKYWVEINMNIRAWSYEDIEYIAVNFINTKLTLSKFKEIVKELEGEEYMGDKIDEEYLYENFEAVGELLFGDFNVAYCQHAYGDLLGVDKRDMWSHQFASCSFSANVFLTQE